MSLETLLEAAEYLEWRSDLDSRDKKFQPYPRSPPTKASIYAAADTQLPESKRSSDGSEEESCDKKRWAGTREVHNKLEKNRRAHLKECFELLRHEVPSVDDRKTSNLSILQKALRYIQVITTKEKELEDEKKRLATVRNIMHARVAQLKKDVKAMNIVPDVDLWLESQQDSEDCSTSTASECGDEEQSKGLDCKVEVKPFASRRLQVMDSKDDVTKPAAAQPVDLYAGKLPPPPALQRIQNAAIRATLQQRLHMRVVADASSLAAVVATPETTNKVALETPPAPSAAASPSAPAISMSVIVAPVAPPSAGFAPLPANLNGLHSSALLRAAWAAGGSGLPPGPRSLAAAAASTARREIRPSLQLSAASTKPPHPSPQLFHLVPASDTGTHMQAICSQPAVKRALAPQPTAQLLQQHAGGVIFSATQIGRVPASSQADAFPLFLADALQFAQGSAVSFGGATSAAVTASNGQHVYRHPSIFAPVSLTSLAAITTMTAVTSASFAGAMSSAPMFGSVALASRGPDCVSELRAGMQLPKQIPVHIVARPPYVLMSTAGPESYACTNPIALHIPPAAATAHPRSKSNGDGASPSPGRSRK